MRVCVCEVEGMAAGGWWVCSLVFEEREVASRGAVIGRKGRRIDRRIDRFVDNRFVEGGYARSGPELEYAERRRAGQGQVWLADSRWLLVVLEAGFGCGAGQ